MYSPKLTDTERELVNQLISLPKENFRECMTFLERELFLNELEDEKVRKVEPADEFYAGQGRIKARYYAWMRLASATLELDEAKKELNNVMVNWENLQKDAPIYWDNRKTEKGWKKVLVGDVARDYKEPTHPQTGKAKLYFPDGEVSE